MKTTKNRWCNDMNTQHSSRNSETVSHAAFISYATPDRPKAEAICDSLEAKGLKCWIAPRDVRSGRNYPEEIIRGIGLCRCLVLVLSEAANESTFVRLEVERAVSKRKPVFPIRVEDVLPSPSLELLVASTHWIDAWAGDLVQHMDRLARDLSDDRGEAVLQSGVGRCIELNEDFTSSIGMEMRLVHPGSLRINQRNLLISTGYYLGVTQVTQAQWQAVMGSNPSHFSGRPSHPVENVSWIDAREFCRRLNELDYSAGKLPFNYYYDLPTEAQWEYACRAGSAEDSAHPLKTMAWYGGPLRLTFGTRPVATKAPNSWGFYDMHGNVMEWCLDQFEGIHPEPQFNRVLKGGCYISYFASECRCDSRHPYPEQSRDDRTGLRVAAIMRGPDTVSR